MQRVWKFLIYILSVIKAIMVVSVLSILAYYSYGWLAWNVLTKEFDAVCTNYAELTGENYDSFSVVEGPYTQEFWEQLQTAYSEFPNQLKDEWAIWQEDGRLRVPVGFDFEPEDAERLNVMGGHDV